MWYMWGNVCISLACDLLSIFHTVFIFPYLIITVLEYKIYYFFYLKTKTQMWSWMHQWFAGSELSS